MVNSSIPSPAPLPAQLAGPKIPIKESISINMLRPEWRVFAEKRLPTIASPVERHRILRDLLVLQNTSGQYRGSPTQSSKAHYAGALRTPSHAEISNRLGQYNPEILPLSIIEEMDLHPMIFLGVGLLRYIVRSTKWHIECDDSQQRKCLTRWVEDFWPDIIRSLSNGFKYGSTTCEIVYALRNQEIVEWRGNPKARHVVFSRKAFVIDEVKDLYPGSIRIVQNHKGRFLGVRQYQPDGTDEFIKKGFKLMHSVFEPDHGNWWGKTRYRAANKAWYWGSLTEHFAMTHQERQGIGKLLVEHPPGTFIHADGREEDAGEFALALAMGALGHMVAAIPQEWDDKGNPRWNMKFLESNNRNYVWTEMLAYWDRMMIRGLCIPDTAIIQGYLPGGTAAGAEATQSLMVGTTASVLQSIAHSLTSDIVLPLHVSNWLPENRSYARFVFQDPDFDRPTMIKQLAQDFMQMTGAFMQMGYTPRLVPAMGEIGRLLGCPMETVEEAFDDGQVAAVQAAKQKLGTQPGDPGDGRPAPVPPDGGGNGTEAEGNEKKGEK